MNTATGSNTVSAVLVSASLLCAVGLCSPISGKSATCLEWRASTVLLYANLTCSSRIAHGLPQGRKWGGPLLSGKVLGSDGVRVERSQYIAGRGSPVYSDGGSGCREAETLFARRWNCAISACPAGPAARRSAIATNAARITCKAPQAVSAVTRTWSSVFVRVRVAQAVRC